MNEDSFNYRITTVPVKQKVAIAQLVAFVNQFREVRAKISHHRHRAGWENETVGYLLTK